MHLKKQTKFGLPLPLKVLCLAGDLFSIYPEVPFSLKPTHVKYRLLNYADMNNKSRLD